MPKSEKNVGKIAKRICFDSFQHQNLCRFKFDSIKRGTVFDLSLPLYAHLMLTKKYNHSIQYYFENKTNSPNYSIMATILKRLLISLFNFDIV